MCVFTTLFGSVGLAIAANIALAVGAAASAAGTALGAVGAYQQGQSESAAYEYQAQVQQENAKIAKENAVQMNRVFYYSNVIFPIFSDFIQNLLFFLGNSI